MVYVSLSKLDGRKLEIMYILFCESKCNIRINNSSLLESAEHHFMPMICGVKDVLMTY